MKKTKIREGIPVICCWCSQIAAARRDKFQRPYVSCPSCGSRHFFKTPIAEIGYDMVCEMIRQNHEWFLSELNRRYAAKMQAIQTGLIADFTAKAKQRK